MLAEGALCQMSYLSSPPCLLTLKNTKLIINKSVSVTSCPSPATEMKHPKTTVVTTVQLTPLSSFRAGCFVLSLGLPLVLELITLLVSYLAGGSHGHTASIEHTACIEVGT